VAAAAGRPPLTDVTAADAPRVFSATEADVEAQTTTYGLRG
jgi:3-phytase